MMIEKIDSFGRLVEADSGWRLEFSRWLPHPPERVWRAVTEPDELDAWFPTTVAGRRSPGSRLRFAFHYGTEPSFGGEVLAFVPIELFEFKWGVDDIVRFELHPDGAGTTLEVFHTFAERGKATHDGAGWHECFELLSHWLDGQKPPFETGERWAETWPEYARRFGPDASRLGPPEHHW